MLVRKAPMVMLVRKAPMGEYFALNYFNFLQPITTAVGLSNILFN